MIQFERRSRFCRRDSVSAGIAAGDRVTVEVELDDEPRTVELPADLAAALDTDAVGFLRSLRERVRTLDGS